MYCSECGKQLSEEDHFCSKCGQNMKKDRPLEKDKNKISPEVTYGNYLSIGGWLIIIVCGIIAIYFFTEADTYNRRFNEGMIFSGIGIFISGVIYAWLYFGLHKAIQKIERIEQVLGISKYKSSEAMGNSVPGSFPPTDKDTAEGEGVDQEDLPWELRDPKG
jgi:hypothetical protein